MSNSFLCTQKMCYEVSAISEFSIQILCSAIQMSFDILLKILVIIDMTIFLHGD